jgi:hypothetical protein
MRPGFTGLSRLFRISRGQHLVSSLRQRILPDRCRSFNCQVLVVLAKSRKTTEVFTQWIGLAASASPTTCAHRLTP